MNTRRCAEPECGTILSFYNPEDRCWIHSTRRPIAGSGLNVRSLRRMPTERDELLTEDESAAFWDGTWVK